jgi:hypothetical protein
VDSSRAAAPDPALPLRAPFRRGPRRFDVGEFALDVVVGIPVPRRRSDEDLGTELPPGIVLEVDTEEVRVLDDRGEAVLETWPRGSVDARIDLLDDKELWLELRWPRNTRGGRIIAETSPDARRIADLLVADTRVRRGAAREPGEALRRLVAEGLPERVQIERHRAISGVAMLLRDGERPLLVAGAARGFSDGIVVLTDRALLWWTGGRKDPLLLPRDRIRSAATSEPLRDAVDLTVQPRDGKDIVLSFIEPPDRGPDLASALNPRADALDELLAKERDGSAFLLLRDRLDTVRPLLHEGERAATYAGAVRRTSSGVLIVTDRRLLWVPKKGGPTEIDRAEITAAKASRKLILTHVALVLTGGRFERFDAIEPRDRAEAIVEALGFASV